MLQARSGEIDVAKFFALAGVLCAGMKHSIHQQEVPFSAKSLYRFA
jgi:hypothetical protein